MTHLKVYHSNMKNSGNEKYRYVWLLACLSLYMMTPIYKELKLPGHTYTSSLLYACIVFTALRSCFENKKLFVWMIALALPALLAHWAKAADIYDSVSLIMWTSILFNISYIAIITKEMLQFNCSIHNRLAASLCNYLFIGITFGYVYTLIEMAYPGSFHFPVEMAATSDIQSFGSLLGTMNYHSFVTLATLGYGEIHPLSAMSRCACVIEALIGQIYLVVVVTSVVGGNITQVFHKEAK